MLEDMNTKAAVTGKVLITGALVLESPLLIGSGAEEGEPENDKDIHVLKDQTGRPFIPGTSLCGVLREFLRSFAGEPEITEMMFGGQEDDFVWREAGMQRAKNSVIEDGQSMIEVDDIVLDNAKIVYRDGVSIDRVTGVGIDKARYDYEVVERGARGSFRILVTRRRCHEAAWPKLRQTLLLLRERMVAGIVVGAVTAKGLGRVRAENVQAGVYDFQNREDVRAWLQQVEPKPEMAADRMEDKWEGSLEIARDLIMEADFSLRTSVIVRDYERKKEMASDGKSGVKMFDAVSLQSGDRYVLPGTSLKGVLRHQAERIVERLGVSETFLPDLMGYSLAEGEKERGKSRFWVEESLLTEHVQPAGQARIRIDRFTGSVMDSALFTEEPLWQAEQGKKAFRLRLTIKEAKPYEVGLALFLLRDLWQGRVAIGGSKSVGRGALIGLGGTIQYEGESYILDAQGKVTQGRQENLEKYAASFLQGQKGEV